MGEHQRSLAVLGKAEARARKVSDQLRLGEILSRMVTVRRIVGDFDGAMTTGQEALELAVMLGEPALHVHASYRLGQVYAGMGDYSRAAEMLRGTWRCWYVARGLTCVFIVSIRSHCSHRC